jgi:cell division septum initiation protein DivIVA
MERKQEQNEDVKLRVKELQHQVDELKELVNTLLSVIVEEPDGVHSGAAPTIPGQGMMQVCM